MGAVGANCEKKSSKGVIGSISLFHKVVFFLSIRYTRIIPTVEMGNVLCRSR